MRLRKRLKKLSPFDLVICGERATDGETGQVGPGIAAWLDLPLATYVSQVIEAGTDFLRLERLIEGGREVIWSQLPMVLTVVKECGNPRLSTIRSKLKARKVEIPTWGADDIEANSEWIGLKGSPTRVVKIYSPQLARKGQVIAIKEPEDLEKAGAAFVQFLKDRNLTNFILHHKGRG